MTKRPPSNLNNPKQVMKKSSLPEPPGKYLSKTSNQIVCQICGFSDNGIDKCGQCKLPYCSDHLRKLRKIKTTNIKVCDSCEDKNIFDIVTKSDTAAEEDLLTRWEIVKLRYQDVQKQMGGKEEIFQQALLKKMKIMETSNTKEKETKIKVVKDLQKQISALTQQTKSVDEEIGKIDTKEKEIKKNLKGLLGDIVEMQSMVKQRIQNNKYEGSRSIIKEAEEEFEEDETQIKEKNVEGQKLKEYKEEVMQQVDEKEETQKSIVKQQSFQQNDPQSQRISSQSQKMYTSDSSEQKILEKQQQQFKQSKQDFVNNRIVEQQSKEPVQLESQKVTEDVPERIVEFQAEPSVKPSPNVIEKKNYPEIQIVKQQTKQQSKINDFRKSETPKSSVSQHQIDTQTVQQQNVKQIVQQVKSQAQNKKQQSIQKPQVPIVQIKPKQQDFQIDSSSSEQQEQQKEQSKTLNQTQNKQSISQKNKQQDNKQQNSSVKNPSIVSSNLSSSIESELLQKHPQSPPSKLFRSNFNEAQYLKLQRIDSSHTAFSLPTFITHHKNYCEAMQTLKKIRIKHKQSEQSLTLLKQRKKKVFIKKSPKMLSLIEQKQKLESLMQQISKQFQNFNKQQKNCRQKQKKQVPAEQDDYTSLLNQKRKIEKQINQLQMQRDTLNDTITKKEAMLQNEYIEWEARQRNNIVRGSTIKKKQQCLLF